MCAGLTELVTRLDAAVAAETSDAITASVKATLEDLLGSSRLIFSDRFRVTRPDCYARRLLSVEDAGGYVPLRERESNSMN